MFSVQNEYFAVKVRLTRYTTNNGRAEALPLFVVTRSVENGTKYLLGGHFFLFAFHAHLFQFALFGFDGCCDFLLDLGCRFF
jgi:hypothetical protein